MGGERLCNVAKCGEFVAPEDDDRLLEFFLTRVNVVLENPPCHLFRRMFEQEVICPGFTQLTQRFENVPTIDGALVLPDDPTSRACAIAYRQQLGFARRLQQGEYADLPLQEAVSRYTRVISQRTEADQRGSQSPRRFWLPRIAIT